MRGCRKASARTLLWVLWLACVIATTPAGAATDAGAGGRTERPWWKGNLHTHTFWSDGDHFPEMVVQWYKEHGYHFLALSDHNRLSQGQRWMTVADKQQAAFDEYVARFGKGWVETRRSEQGPTQVRLKPLSECRGLFEEPGRFLLIQAEEVSEKAHLNAINLLELIPPQGGPTIPDILQNNVNALLAQQEKTGQPMLVHINHPNFQWALTAEDMVRVKGARFFEVYNAHGYVNNEGNELQASTERIWDIILTRRLEKAGAEVVYGVATDDAHNYHKFEPRAANPGQAWVMVRAAYLTPEFLIRAMDAGDFYCSTGVTLKDVTFESNTLAVQVAPERDVTYRIRFIGTRRGYDPASRAVVDAEGKPIRTTRIYSPEVGAVLAENRGTSARYTLKGDEIYVRAKIISSRRNEKSHVPDEYESAWVQPVVVK